MKGDHNMHQKTTGIHEQQFFAEETRPVDRTSEAINALSAALAEPEAEPVAWYLPSEDGCDSMFRDHRTVVACTGNPWTGWQPLYATPPRREWQSLTEEEIEAIWDGALTPYRMQQLREIENKLKEKNT